jgi:hypothetical protein
MDCYKGYGLLERVWTVIKSTDSYKEYRLIKIMDCYKECGLLKRVCTVIKGMDCCKEYGLL